MDSLPVRLQAVAITLLLAAGIVTVADRGAGSGDATQSPTPAAVGTLPAGRCQQLPARGETPSWYPSDLPLPAGSYTSALKLPTTSNFPRAIFAVRGTLRDFVIHALKVWPQTGWVLGRGEAEAGEAEDNFYKPGTDIRGAFIARQDFCDPGWTWVYMVIGHSKSVPSKLGPSPTGSASPLQ